MHPQVLKTVNKVYVDFDIYCVFFCVPKMKLSRDW